MKAEGHPTLNNVCFLDIGTGRRFLTRSTMKSARKEQIDGQEYFVVARDVTSDSHPAYTGEKRLVDFIVERVRNRRPVPMSRKQTLLRVGWPSAFIAEKGVWRVSLGGPCSGARPC